MSHSVYLIEDAERDILELYEYIAQSDSIEKAEYIFYFLMSNKNAGKLKSLLSLVATCFRPPISVVENL